MEDLPTDILLHELGEWLYPYERFKLCGISTIFAHIFSIDHFKFNHHHYKYDCVYYTKYLQPYLHDGTCNLSQNAISELDELQLKHLKYLIIFHRKLYKIYGALSRHSSHSLKPSFCHTSSSSSSQIPSIFHTEDHSSPQRRESMSSASFVDNPFLKALKCINVIDLSKSASSFAIKPYHLRFLCAILSCGFNVPSDTTPSLSPKLLKYKSLQTETESTKKQSESALSLNLSGNNLNSFDLSCICKCIKHRYKPLNLSKLDLSINHNINDTSVGALFRCIGTKCHNLNAIDLSYANITDLSANIIYKFYHKYFINTNTNHVLLHKIDLSFTRISEHGLFILDQLFNELPKSVIYIHNKHHRKDKHAVKPKQKVQNVESKHAANVKKVSSKRRKSQSFEIVLKGCFFEPMACKNYNCLASIPKLQTHCCIEIKADSAESSD
eukprot:255083_1